MKAGGKEWWGLFVLHKEWLVYRAPEAKSQSGNNDLYGCGI